MGSAQPARPFLPAVERLKIKPAAGIDAKISETGPADGVCCSVPDDARAAVLLCVRHDRERDRVWVAGMQRR